jgi:exosortase
MQSEKMKFFRFDWRAFFNSPNLLASSLRLFLLIILPLVAYFQDFVQLVYLALSDPEIQYVLLVPFIAAFFFYRQRKAFMLYQKASNLYGMLGFSLCSLALVIYIWGSYSFYILPIHLVSLPILVAGIILLLFGPTTLRLLIFPTFLLFFLTPFPSVLTDMFGASLMSIAANISASILRLFLPIQASYTPIVTLSTVTTTGQLVSFQIAAACSGIESLTAMAFFAAVFLYVASGSLTKKTIFVGLALFTAYALNVFRISSTVVLGHFFGYGLAVDFFHNFGGIVLLFCGTLILLFVSDKVLKLAVIQGKPDLICPYCSEYEDTCQRCGRVLKLPKIHIEWKQMAVILLFLLIVTTLVFQASGIAYNKVVSNQSVSFDISSGKTSALNITGWSPMFTGRETDAESELGLYYVGDYLLFRQNSSEAIVAILELSDAQSKFHTWEGCLHYQAYEIDIEKTLYTAIYDQNGTIVTAETFITNVPAFNDTLIVSYWFDELNLNTNGTTRIWAVKLSLLKYIYYGANPANATEVDAATNQVINLAEQIEQSWSPYKVSTTSFVVDIHRNQEASTAFVAGILIFSTALLVSQSFLTRSRASKKAKDLSKEDRDLLGTFDPEKPDSFTESEEKDIATLKPDDVQRFKQQGLLKEQTVIKNGQLYIKWESLSKTKPPTSPPYKNINFTSPKSTILGIKTKLAKPRTITLLTGIMLIIIGLGLVSYVEINIQDRVRALADPALTQQDRWSLAGSLAWWQSFGQTMYTLLAAILIAAGLVAIISSRFRKAD